MKLVLDFGNTLQKIALFKNNELCKFGTLKELTRTGLQEEIASLFQGMNDEDTVQSCILSSVINFPAGISDYLRDHYQFIEFSHQTPIPVVNRYKSPETLGKDRLASAIGAYFLNQSQNSLAITAGTCITFDFINASGEYLGGAISPGLKMRFKALHTFTSQLPLIENPDEPVLTGTNTYESITSGVINGIVNEIEGMISDYTTLYPGLKVILSGGDYKYFADRLKSPIFALPNLVLAGLNQVLEYNEVSNR